MQFNKQSKAASMASLLILVVVASSLAVSSVEAAKPVPINKRVVDWMVRRIDVMLREADQIAHMVSNPKANFDGIVYLRFMRIMSQLNTVKDLDILEFDIVRQKLEAYEAANQHLTKIFSIWIGDKVHNLLEQEKRDLAANKRKLNLPPSKKWKNFFDDVKLFMKYVGDKRILIASSQLLNSKIEGGVFTSAAIQRQNLVEKYIPYNLEA